MTNALLVAILIYLVLIYNRMGDAYSRMKDIIDALEGFFEDDDDEIELEGDGNNESKPLNQ